MANRLGIFVRRGERTPGDHYRVIWNALRSIQHLALVDKCRILKYVEVYDTINNYTYAYVPDPEINCRLQVTIWMDRGGFEYLESTEIALGSISLIVPLETDVNARDRVRITWRQLDDLPDEEFEVVGQIYRGTTAQVMKVRPLDKAISPAMLP